MSAPNRVDPLSETLPVEIQDEPTTIIVHSGHVFSDLIQFFKCLPNVDVATKHFIIHMFLPTGVEESGEDLGVL